MYIVSLAFRARSIGSVGKADAYLLKGFQDVLLAADFGQERATGDNMDSCAFGAQAAEESGHRNKHQCLCRYVPLLFPPNTYNNHYHLKPYLLNSRGNTFEDILVRIVEFFPL